MANENEFLLQALFMGIFITFVYDILRIFRRVFPHKNFLVSLEDIAFWIYCAAKVFLLMYYESNGTLRWFAVLGALAGMLLYKKLVSPYFVRHTSLALQKGCGILKKSVRFLLRPLVFLFRKLQDKICRHARKLAVRRMKKRELNRRKKEERRKLAEQRKKDKIRKNQKQVDVFSENV